MKSTQSHPEVMSMDTHPDCYGPNYRSAKDERKVTRKARNLSWFDSWAFALLLVCVLTPAFFVVAAVGAHNDCRTTQTMCSVQP